MIRNIKREITVCTAKLLVRLWLTIKHGIDGMMASFGGGESGGTDEFDVWKHVDEVDMTPKHRHVDVDLYYRMGEVDKAQAVARQLRPRWVTVGGDLSEEELHRVREKFDAHD